MRCAVYACDDCGAVTMLFGREQISKYLTRDEDDVTPLGACGIARDSHCLEDGDETESGLALDICDGTVAFRGFVYVAEPLEPVKW